MQRIVDWSIYVFAFTAQFVGMPLAALILLHVAVVMFTTSIVILHTIMIVAVPIILIIVIWKVFTEKDDIEIEKTEENKEEKTMSKKYKDPYEDFIADRFPGADPTSVISTKKTVYFVRDGKGWGYDIQTGKVSKA